MDIARFLDLEELTYENMLDAIIGSKQVRFGPRPSPENCTHIQQALDGCVSRNRPIRLLVSWGAYKAYGLFPHFQKADWLDAMALRRLACVHHAVKRFHRPGVRVTIFVEDFTRRMLTGREWTVYHASLNRLILCLGYGDFIRTIRESALITDPTYPERIYRNAEAIREGREALVGWMGAIDWAHYLKRAASELPDSTEEERRAYVSIFLGSILTRAQAKIMPRHELKLSFVPYPKSVPSTMRKGRLEYKIKANKESNHTPAPWTCFGVFCGRYSDWTFASVNDVRACHHKYRHANVMVNNHVIPALREV